MPLYLPSLMIFSCSCPLRMGRRFQYDSPVCIGPVKFGIARPVQGDEGYALAYGNVHRTAVVRNKQGAAPNRSGQFADRKFSRPTTGLCRISDTASPTIFRPSYRQRIRTYSLYRQVIGDGGEPVGRPAFLGHGAADVEADELIIRPYALRRVEIIGRFIPCGAGNELQAVVSVSSMPS